MVSYFCGNFCHISSFGNFIRDLVGVHIAWLGHIEVSHVLVRSSQVHTYAHTHARTHEQALPDTHAHAHVRIMFTYAPSAHNHAR